MLIFIDEQCETQKDKVLFSKVIPLDGHGAGSTWSTHVPIGSWALVINIHGCLRSYPQIPSPALLAIILVSFTYFWPSHFRSHLYLVLWCPHPRPTSGLWCLGYSLWFWEFYTCPVILSACVALCEMLCSNSSPAKPKPNLGHPATILAVLVN